MADTNRRVESKLGHSKSKSVHFSDVPLYLQKTFSSINTYDKQIPLLSLKEIRELNTSSLNHAPDTRQVHLKHAHLLLLREHLTQRMCSLSDSCAVPFGVSPELILERAKVYEALAYADLALADAYVAFSVVSGDEEDLKAIRANGVAWDEEDGATDGDLTDEGQDEGEDGDADGGGLSSDELQNGEISEEDESTLHDIDLLRARVKRDALCIIVRGLTSLGCRGELGTWSRLLSDADDEVRYSHHNIRNDSNDGWTVYDGMDSFDSKGVGHDQHNDADPDSVFGFSRREIYPWNTHEPQDRTSDDSLRQINERLFKGSNGCLEARKTVLPFMKASETSTNLESQSSDNAQIGLFALRDLSANEKILREHSVLTAIRPHDAPLCDACTGELPDTPTQIYACSGCSITFCSEECLVTALNSYHAPNIKNETTETGFPPSTSPFCPGTSAHGDIHDIGRAESSDEPEWDLYFLLVARCIMMATTQNIHPLDLVETKWLWGDFNPLPALTTKTNTATTTTTTTNSNSNHTSQSPTLTYTLPFSLTHSLLHPHSFLTTLLLSRPKTHPYSAFWLRNLDFWILQTLFAKFRGVADARQSTWDGKPECAGVYGLWCLGNHSCEPSVSWEGEGVREYVVRGVGERSWEGEEEGEGRKKGKMESAEREIGANGLVDGETGGKLEGSHEGEGEGEHKGEGGEIMRESADNPVMIKRGEEIWNHYTDITEPDFRVRRARLREVLGGECLCTRCVREEEECVAKQANGEMARDETGDGDRKASG